MSTYALHQPSRVHHVQPRGGGGCSCAICDPKSASLAAAPPTSPSCYKLLPLVLVALSYFFVGSPCLVVCCLLTMKSTIKICRCAWVAAAVGVVVQVSEAYAPSHQQSHPLQAAFPDEGDLLSSTNQLLKIKPQLTQKKVGYTPIEAASSPSRDPTRTTSRPRTLSRTTAKAKAQNHRSKERRKTMQRPVLGSALKQKKQRSPQRLLTAQEEIEFAFRIRAYRAAVKLRDQQLVRLNAQGVYVHPTEREWAAACGCTVSNLRRLLDEGQQARAALVAANAGLVVQQAKRHHAGLKHATEAGGGLGTILTVSDMIQEGNLGLMEAAERFDPEKGFRFSTYATYWVRQRILRSISDSSRTIRLPAHVHDMLQRIRKAKVEIKGETGREPGVSELAHYMEVPEAKLRLYTASSRNVVSLERPVDSSKAFEEDRRTLGDTLASDAPTPEEDAVQDSMRRDIRTVMDMELVGSERQVLILRFGLEVGKPLNVSETAQTMGISRDRVRLIEARALNKLRHPTRNYKLKEYIAHQGASGDACIEEEKKELSDYSSALEETFANSPSPAERPDRLWFF